jgi:hypothetical protein
MARCHPDACRVERCSSWKEIRSIFVPVKIPFDAPHAPPISLERARAAIDAAVANAKKRNWKMNVHAETAPMSNTIDVASDMNLAPPSNSLHA